MIFESNPYGILTLITAIVALILAISIWSRRPARGVVPFVVLMLMVALWSFGFAMEIMVTTSALKAISLWFAYIGVATVPAAWLVFILAYTGQDKFITRRNLLLLSIHPLLMMVVIATNELHGFFWSSTVLTSFYDSTLDATVLVNVNELNWFFWLHALYSYILILGGTGLLALSFWRTPSLYRGQMVSLMIAQFIPLVTNAIFITNTSPLPAYVDITPFGFTLTGALIAWSVYRYKFMDMMPVAHHAIFNSMPDAVFVLDTQNRFVSANPSAINLMNSNEKDILGKPASLIFASQPQLLESYRDVHNVEHEITVVRNAVEHTYLLRISPLLDRDGTVSGRIFTLHDITQLKQINRELELARQKADEVAHLKSEFLATMSHELRTPLSAILGYSQLLNANPHDPVPESMQRPLIRIEENGKYLLSMINNILDLSKLQAERVNIAQAPVEMDILVAGWQEQLLVLAQSKAITFTVDIAPGFPNVILTDREHLSQIAINLLSNAIKFTHEGSVTLSLKADEDVWFLQVKDTGEGISEEAQGYIFDEFRQVHQGQNYQQGGTGLGLAIVKRLVMKMKGDVWVESALGEGSTFYVRLPLLLPVSDAV